MLTEMMEANRLVSVALRSGSLEQRSRALAFAQRVLREGRQ
jgi:hypothetical protein